MTALAVLAIAFVVLLGLRNTDIAISAKAARVIDATLLARQKMADISLLKDKDTSERRGDFGKDFPDYKWEMDLNETPYERVRELVVRVLWQSQGDTESVEFTRYLFIKK
jgi:general secretion pathway protein I